MTVGERVRTIRKANDMTLEQFGARVGMGSSSISDIENDRRTLTKQTFLSICREFNVREAWLRTGDGDMFQPKSRSNEIDAFMKEILRDDSDFRQKFISVLARMTADEWKLLEQKVLEIASEVTGEDHSAPTQTDTDIEQEANAVASEVRDQVILEKKVGVESSALLSDTGGTAGKKMA